MISEFLFSLIIFIGYLIVICTFGYFIIYILNRKEKNIKKFTLEYFLGSLGVGLSIQISFSIFLIKYQIFNFFTSILPFLLFDIMYVVFLFLKKKIILNKQFFLRIHTRINLFNIFFVLLFIFLNSFLLLSFIELRIAYPGSDPYVWFRNCWFLHKNGYLIEKYYGYAPGFTIFTASIISGVNDYYLIYYILKYIPVFLSNINILTLFLISKSYFKNKNYVFLILSLYIGSTQISYRYISLFSSNLATTLSFIILIFIFQKIPVINLENKKKLKEIVKENLNNKNSIFIGIILGGISIINPLYGLIYIFYLFSYEIIYFLIRVQKGNMKYVGSLLISLIQSIIFCFLIILPYLITNPLRTNYFVKIIKIFFPLMIFKYNSQIGILFSNFLMLICNYNPYDYYNRLFFLDFFYLTLGVGFFIILISIFLPFKKKFNLSNQKAYLISFIKYSVILTLMVYLFMYFLRYLTSFYYEIIPIFNYFAVFSGRFLEIFSGYWTILFGFCINSVILYFKKSKSFNQIIKKSFHKLHKRKRILIPFLVLFISSYFICTGYERIIYRNYYEDNKTKAILYIGNYFNENPLSHKNIILLQDDFIVIYYLIEFNNLEKKYYFFNISENVYYLVNHITKFYRVYIPYYDLNLFFKEINCTFIFYNIKDLNSELNNVLTNNFTIIYQNEGGYVFARKI